MIKTATRLQPDCRCLRWRSLIIWFGVLEMSLGGPTFIFAAPVAFFEIVVVPAWLFFRGFSMPDGVSATPARAF